MEEVKKGKKKNKVASLLLALALILTCGVAGTIAQYQKSFTGNSTASVASFKVDAQGLGTSSTKEFSLFENLTDTNTLQTDGVEGDVTTGKIAPGTQGYHDITLTNSSEVSVEYTLATVLANNTGKILKADSSIEHSGDHLSEYIPLEFALEVDPTTNPTKASEYTALNLTWTKIEDASTSIAKAKTEIKQGKTQTVRIYWRWVFDDASDTDRNELDTVIGEAIANNKTDVFLQPKLDVTVTFTQKD